jgi:hypothetical protein
VFVWEAWLALFVFVWEAWLDLMGRDDAPEAHLRQSTQGQGRAESLARRNVHNVQEERPPYG